MPITVKNSTLFTGGSFKAVECQSFPSDMNAEFHNCLVIPGLADVHVHLREPGFSYKETIKTGSMAAAARIFDPDPPDRLLPRLQVRAGPEPPLHLLPAAVATRDLRFIHARSIGNLPPWTEQNYRADYQRLLNRDDRRLQFISRLLMKNGATLKGIRYGI